MPNDFLSLRPSPRRSARLVEGTYELLSRARWIACIALTCIVLPSCGGDEDNTVTYGDDVQPIFRTRCTTCHHPSSPIGVDIQNPFAPDRGLVNAPNSWGQEHPELGMPTLNVAPGDPENSFLIDKLTGNLPVNGNGGASMPYQVPPITPPELAILEKWVTDGAHDDQYFENNVRPIFGSEDSVSSFYGGKCIFCHYTGSPNPLDLSNPFGDNGLVNVEASYRGGTVRVLPGSPDESLMILKVRAVQSSSDIGAQMPYSYRPLSANEVDTVRQWIVEGAKP
jgi:hypothetical protein